MFTDLFSEAHFKPAIHIPAKFSSNPNQTHLSMLINVFRINRKSQVGEFDRGWSWTQQGIGPPGQDWRNPALNYEWEECVKCEMLNDWQDWQ